MVLESPYCVFASEYTIQFWTVRKNGKILDVERPGNTPCARYHHLLFIAGSVFVD